MARYYRVRFYSDVSRHDETEPCEAHSRAYAKQLEAEKAARSAMLLIRGQYGARAGYVVADQNGEPVSFGRLTAGP